MADDGSAPNQAQPAVDNDGDADSAIGGDVKSFATSLKSSVQNYKYHNGRRYHAYREGEYLLPNDEDEQDRLDILAHVYRLVFDGELLQRKPKPMSRVLDVGTGTGIWAIDMADEFPDAHIMGTDLSPIQPSWVPPNCEFIVDDVEAPWNWDAPFDVIHASDMGGSISDWPKFYEKCLENLTPGGVVEVHDFHFHFRTQTASMPPALAKYNECVNGAAEKFGKALDIGHLHKGLMEKAGFIDVKETLHRIPVGTWPLGKKDKEIGHFQLGNILMALEAYGLGLLTQVGGMSVEEAHALIALCRSEVKDPKNQIYANLYWVSGTKSEEIQGANA